MKYLGEPFVIQNTADRGWLVTWTNAVRVSTDDGELIESVSFTVSIPKRAALSIAEVQTFALKRAAELLQASIQAQQES